MDRIEAMDRIEVMDRIEAMDHTDLMVVDGNNKKLCDDLIE